MSYAPTEHIISHGKKLAYGEVSETPTYLEVFGNFEIDLPDGELSEAETTNDDTPDFGKSHIPGMYDWGKASFKYKYTKSGYATMEAVYLLASVAGTRATAVKSWKVTASDGSTWVFTGFITKHTLPLGKDDDVPEVEGEIRCTSKPVFVAGT